MNIFCDFTQTTIYCWRRENLSAIFSRLLRVFRLHNGWLLIKTWYNKRLTYNRVILHRHLSCLCQLPPGEVSVFNLPDIVCRRVSCCSALGVHASFWDVIWINTGVATRSERGEMVERIFFFFFWELLLINKQGVGINIHGKSGKCLLECFQRCLRFVSKENIGISCKYCFI